MALEKITANAGETLKDIAYKYLGDFELWQVLADTNDLTAFDDITNLELRLPNSEEISVTLNSFVSDDFTDLTDQIKTINNWQSLQWI